MTSGLQKTITKRSRFAEDISRCNNDITISDLPDAVISHILSFLPTKYAVGTTILSKRWNYLWTTVKNLDFDSSLILNINRSYYANSNEFMKSFVDFVEHVLFSRDGMSIDKCRISSRSRVCDNQIYTWVSAVVPCNLKELQVISTSVRQTDIPSAELWHVDLPWSLFTCKTLTTLKLSGEFLLRLPTRVCLPVLKVLHLSSVIYVDDISLHNLISGCPVLEDLDIERRNWDGVQFMESSKNFKLPMFYNLVRLELGANKEAGWDLLAELLESTPNLEVLVFPRGLVKRIRSLKKPYFEFEWYPPKGVPGCLLLSLEMIIIHEFFGKNCEIDLVEYLLENAKVLKHMTIYFSYFKSQESCQRNLLRCQRGSPTCKLDLILNDGFYQV